MSDPEPEVPFDGRTARRDRNREAVLDAVLDLFADGSMTPVPAEVAERSGVSLRSVYRYFDDMDALVRAAIARNLARMGPLFDLDDPGRGPLADRVDRTVAARLRLHDGIAPMARAAVARAPQNPLIDERLQETRLLLRRQVEEMFAPELAELDAEARHDVVAAIDVLLELDSIDHLRRHRRMGAAQAHRVLVRAVGAQFSASPATS
ncbi:TetR/AcrR family transcriptional regulator [Aquihabitans daechungensis]|uniref:TetR/AcrR family transcriptional regulator n=1 Tax=Aquihabitans daechungensis TaxID=1052257 RepID=UPI003BA2B197